MDLTSPAKTQSETASFTTAMVEAALVPSLWQQLPAELLEKVLSKLPLSALRKFSRVSKRWKALFRSVEFGRKCESVEWTFFYQAFIEGIPYMFLPNLNTNSWDKHSLDFIRADEYMDIHLNDYHVAVDSGLLCYFISKSGERGFDPSITLVVQNHLTLKWRRLIIPCQLEGNLNCHKRMWGLMVDRENESYKVIVAFYDQNLLKKAFIYDSVSNSWSNFAALTLVLVRPSGCDYGWKVRSVVWPNGEVLWLVDESQELVSKTLIVEGEEYIDHHHMAEMHLVMVNLRESRGRPFPCTEPGLPKWTPSSVRLSLELELVPNLGKIKEDIDRLVNEAGDTEWQVNFEDIHVAFGGGTWYIVSRSFRPKKLFGIFISTRVFDIFSVNVNLLTVTRLPKIDEAVLKLGTFAATLKAFV